MGRQRWTLRIRQALQVLAGRKSAVGDLTLKMAERTAVAGRRVKHTGTVCVQGQSTKVPTRVHGTTDLKFRAFTSGQGWYNIWLYLQTHVDLKGHK